VEQTRILTGHRLIRRIGTGTRAEIFLATGADGSSPLRPIAVKIFRQGTDTAGIGREVHAMLENPAAALPSLDDVATTPDGRLCLLLELLPGRSLDTLLTERGRIDAAEVVTVAATVTATLQALHTAGLSYPAVRTGCVRFDATGRPVLTGLGSLVAIPAGAAGVAVRRDTAVGLATFLQSLLAYLDPEDPAASTARELLAEFSNRATARPFPAGLAGQEGALFAWAAAGPVRGAVPGTEPGAEPGAEPVGEPVGERARNTGAWSRVHVPAPLGSVTEQPTLAAVAGVPARLPAAAGPTRRGTGTGPSRRIAGLRAVAVRRVDDLRRSVPALVHTVVSAAHRVTPRRAPARKPALRPILAGAGLVVILSGAGLAVLTPQPSADSSAPSPAPAPSPERTPPSSTGHEPSSLAGSNPTAQPGVLDGEDPAEAVLELLRRREACLADASVLCLDGVAQPGSVLMTADSYAIRQAQTVPEASSAGVEAARNLVATVQERTGNAALVVLSDTSGVGDNAQPASALVIKGEAGWRLRELFDY
jgi:hypothetical protein